MEKIRFRKKAQVQFYWENWIATSTLKPTTVNLHFKLYLNFYLSSTFALVRLSPSLSLFFLSVQAYKPDGMHLWQLSISSLVFTCVPLCLCYFILSALSNYRVQTNVAYDVLVEASRSRTRWWRQALLKCCCPFDLTFGNKASLHFASDSLTPPFCCHIWVVNFVFFIISLSLHLFTFGRLCFQVNHGFLFWCFYFLSVLNLHQTLCFPCLVFFLVCLYVCSFVASLHFLLPFTNRDTQCLH